MLLSSLVALALISPLGAMEMVSEKKIPISLADGETAVISESEWHTLLEMISYKDLVKGNGGMVSFPGLTQNGLEVLRKYLSVIEEGGVPLNELLLNLLKDGSSQEFYDLMVAADYLALESLINSLTLLFDTHFIFIFPPQLGSTISPAERGILKRILTLPVRLRATRQETIERIFLSAAEKDAEETLKFLLENEYVDVNCLDCIKETALMKVIKHGKSNMLVAYLLGKEADVARKDIIGLNALMIAAGCPDDCIDLVKLVFEKGATVVDVNDSASNGYTALTYASEMGNTRVVAFLLNHGADATRRDRIGRNVLVVACGASRDYTDVVQLLIEHDGVSSLDINETVSGRNALTQASATGHEKIVALLLKAGARRCLNTALRLALKGQHQSIVQLLTQNGAVIGEPSDDEVVQEN